MLEPIQSSVICVDGIRASVNRPWLDGEYEWTLIALCIVARDRAEIDKAQIDVMTFGTGLMRISPDGIRHVPLSEWVA